MSCGQCCVQSGSEEVFVVDTSPGPEEKNDSIPQPSPTSTEKQQEATQLTVVQRPALTLQRDPGEINDPSSFQRQVTPTWTVEKGDSLQSSVDRIFGTSGRSLLGLTFSFTIADPFLEGCPLVGCSTGFTHLCGYEFDDIIGRNCRFLVDPVPSEMVDIGVRRHARDFCNAVREGRGYDVPTAEREAWMPSDRPSDELLCMQVNARKDGSLFNNMFFLKVFDIGCSLGEEQPYIVGLQSELPEGKTALSKLAVNLQSLDKNMEDIRAELARVLFIDCGLQRVNG